jgi:hypothetical protein
MTVATFTTRRNDKGTRGTEGTEGTIPTVFRLSANAVQPSPATVRPSFSTIRCELPRSAYGKHMTLEPPVTAVEVEKFIEFALVLARFAPFFHCTGSASVKNI